MLIWGNLAAYLSDHRLATSGSKQTFVALVVNDCDADKTDLSSGLLFRWDSSYGGLTHVKSAFQTL